MKVILENYGFDIIDLGKDVEAEKIVERSKEKQYKISRTKCFNDHYSK